MNAKQIIENVLETSKEKITKTIIFPFLYQVSRQYIMIKLSKHYDLVFFV